MNVVNTLIYVSTILLLVFSRSNFNLGRDDMFACFFLRKDINFNTLKFYLSRFFEFSFFSKLRSFPLLKGR